MITESAKRRARRRKLAKSGTAECSSSAHDGDNDVEDILCFIQHLQLHKVLEVDGLMQPLVFHTEIALRAQAMDAWYLDREYEDVLDLAVTGRLHRLYVAGGCGASQADAKIEKCIMESITPLIEIHCPEAFDEGSCSSEDDGVEAAHDDNRRCGASGRTSLFHAGRPNGIASKTGPHTKEANFRI